ncbi:NAD(P)H-dependent flavin oxidoreductase YrpB (nitropropane dioxygenase family) [Kribbella amoyensis]|uniref:Propionate 3-nitronate monooxygenase n=1 Tax=Kribbella amoyensis TaxID=996641 RepID=A0A561AZL6_9ACTN|nr:nitronate monooxygenase [Kribbella amoyensis]TWD72038.1 NAD(P)H-dependent flavin oxidoreductase YrpB (nitropropane dioxygenase family) [Kribbella amoyensis]
MSTFLDLDLPVIAAPMAGGAGTPALVRAAAEAGGFGFLAAGYKQPQVLADELAAMKASGVPFGVNLFAPNPVPVDLAAFRRYAEVLAPEAERLGVRLDSTVAVEDDDHWHDKLDLLRANPVPVVSLTFGPASPADLAALRRSGALVVQSVTSVEEAKAAVGVDALAVQAAAAGGHSATFTPARPLATTPIADLVTAVRSATGLPVIAAGGLATAEDVAAVIRAGADAAMVGTVLLRSDEAGTSATHKAALADPARTETVLTHAFTGRPARALRSTFTDQYSEVAPYGYPALHHLTSGLRKAAAAAGDPERLHLWAGTGFRHATEEPAAAILTRLAGRL